MRNLLKNKYKKQNNLFTSYQKSFLKKQFNLISFKNEKKLQKKEKISLRDKLIQNYIVKIKTKKNLKKYLKQYKYKHYLFKWRKRKIKQEFKKKYFIKYKKFLKFFFNKYSLSQIASKLSPYKKNKFQLTKINLKFTEFFVKDINKIIFTLIYQKKKLYLKKKFKLNYSLYFFLYNYLKNNKLNRLNQLQKNYSIPLINDIFKKKILLFLVKRKENLKNILFTNINKKDFNLTKKSQKNLNSQIYFERLFLTLTKLKKKTNYFFFLNFPGFFFNTYIKYIKFFFFKKLLFKRYLKSKTLLSFKKIFFIKYFSTLCIKNALKLKAFNNISLVKTKLLLHNLKNKHYFYLFHCKKKNDTIRKKIKILSKKYFSKFFTSLNLYKQNQKSKFYYIKKKNLYYPLFPKFLLAEQKRLYFIHLHNWKFGRISNYSNLRKNYSVFEKLRFNKPKFLLTFQNHLQFNKLQSETFHLPLLTVFTQTTPITKYTLPFFLKMFLQSLNLNLYNFKIFSFYIKKYLLLKKILTFKNQFTKLILQNKKNI